MTCKTPNCNNPIEEPHTEFGEPSEYCISCNDIWIERLNKRREWNTYHDEPCPESELPSRPGESNN